MALTVDEYVDARVLPEHRDIVAMLRALGRECAPDAQELISYGMPVFKGRRIFAWIIPTKRDVTFGFTYGAQFKDDYGLLRGRGKHARHIKIKSATAVDQEALRYYLKQALELDAR